MNHDRTFSEPSFGGKSPETPPRAVFVDKSPAMARALSQQLSISGRVRCDGFTRSDICMVELLAKLRPDLLIFDPAEIGLTADQDLSDVASKLRKASINTHVLCYSFGADDDLVRGVIDARLHGCVSKRSEFHQLEAGVSSVLAGGVYFDPLFTSAVWRLNNRGGPDLGLSEREQAVLARTARGQSAKQIGADLGISSKTVDTYRARAQRKLGLGHRADLIEYAISQGWIG